MSFYLLSEEDLEIVPNSIMACLLDPRHTKTLYKYYGEERLAVVVDGIIEETVVMFQHQDIVRVHMKGAAQVILKALQESELTDESGPEEALAWWRNFMEDDTDSLFKHWGEGAKMFLAMPAGGAPSEIQFSTTGRFVTKLRNRLGDRMLEMCLIIKALADSTMYDFGVLMEAVQAAMDEQEDQEEER